MQHRTFFRLLPGALALLVMTLPLASSAQQIYRWKDANGNTHFTHTPPPSGGAVQKTLTPPPVPDAPAASPSMNAASPEINYSDTGYAAQNQEASLERAPVSAQAKAVECQEARNQLKLMASGAEVAHLGSDGKPVPLEGAARAQEMQRLREFVRQSCEQ